MADNAYEDLYGDLYGDDPVPTPAAAAPTTTEPAPSTSSPSATAGTPSAASAIPSYSEGDGARVNLPPNPYANQGGAGGAGGAGGPPPLHFDPNFKPRPNNGPRPSDVPDEGKMFIGGLNWDTTDDTLRTYFEQFGKVTHSNIMRDLDSQRSRGFAFLTFEDPASVTTVLSKDHYLDGKTIDPKRAVPRDQAQKTDKLFVRAIPPNCTPESFRAFWRGYGTVTDATLMMDKETGRHRGFGFVNYETLDSVEKVLAAGPHYMDGQLLEVKRAQAKGEARRPDYGVNTNQNQNQQYRPAPMNSGLPQQPNNPSINPNGPAGGMGGVGGQPFDPAQMAQFFNQMGWGAWNPMMMGGMMGGPGGFGGMPMGGGGFGGMGMGGFGDPSAMMGMMGGGGMSPPPGGMGGVGGQQQGGMPQGSGAGPQSAFTAPMHQPPQRGGMGGGRGRGGGGGRGGFTHQPPTGPAAMRGPGGAAAADGAASPDASTGGGAQRTAGRGAGFHPYSR